MPWHLMNWQPLPAESGRSAWLHGASAFTTVRTRHGRPLLLPEHLARLDASCTFLGLPAPPAALPELSPLPWGLLRLTVSADGPFWNHRPLPVPKIAQSGAEVWLSQVQIHPQLGRHKTGNYLPYLLAQREAETHGAFEGLLRDGVGNVPDGSRSGILIDLDGRWTVPDDGLRSVTRAAWLAELGVDAAALPVSPDLLRRATGVWLCGAGLGIVPVGEIRAEGWRQRYAVRWPATRNPALILPE